MPDMMPEHTTAVITGSTGGLGRHIALALAEAGFDCVCHYHRNDSAARVLADRIVAGGGRAICVPADLGSPQDISALFEQAKSFGRLRVLINSAAVFAREPIESATFEAARRMLDLNLVAPILAAREFARIVKADNHNTPLSPAKIVNIVDVGGLRPWAEYTVYCASKAGLIGATKSLAKELLPAITVNAVAPGLVSWPDEFSEEEKARQLKQVPMRRMATPAEITDAVLFLLKNDYMTGQVLAVDGGRSI